MWPSLYPAFRRPDQPPIKYRLILPTTCDADGVWGRLSMRPSGATDGCDSPERPPDVSGFQPVLGMGRSEEAAAGRCGGLLQPSLSLLCLGLFNSSLVFSATLSSLFWVYLSFPYFPRVFFVLVLFYSSLVFPAILSCLF